MPIVGIRELARRTSALLTEVEEERKTVLITRHGKAVAAIVPLDGDAWEDFVLANAPEFVESMREADRDAAEGRTRPLEEVVREIEDEERKAGRRTRRR